MNGRKTMPGESSVSGWSGQKGALQDRYIQERVLIWYHCSRSFFNFRSFSLRTGDG
jgi:hypothetical protein